MKKIFGVICICVLCSTTFSATREEKAALKKAEMYSKVMNMSKKAIYEQLVSEYGEAFDVICTLSSTQFNYQHFFL